MIAISALAWGGAIDPTVLARLATEGVAGIEVAPTAVWGTDAWPTDEQLADARRVVEAEGLRIPSIQSLLFGHPELRLFDRDSWPALADHLVRMADVAQGLGATIAVFGSPRNRLRGDLPSTAAVATSAEFFASIAPRFAERGVVLTLEPNPPAYGADFMSAYDEVLAVADATGSPSVAPQVDVGCLHLAGDDPAACVRRRTPAHVHLSAPGLGPVPDGAIDYADVVVALRQADYPGWATVEMLQDRLQGLDDVITAARWAVGAVTS